MWTILSSCNIRTEENDLLLVQVKQKRKEKKVKENSEKLYGEGEKTFVAIFKKIREISPATKFWSVCGRIKKHGRGALGACAL